MRWLIACEFSQRITQALRNVGDEAYSCDLDPTEGNPEWHIQRDAIEVAYEFKWDAMIAHPECTFFTNAGNRWFDDPRYPTRYQDREAALEFWFKLRAAPIPRTAFENPRPSGYVLERIGYYDQVFHPNQFGDPVSKATCLWLHNLPWLNATHHHFLIDAKPAIHHESPGPQRRKNRSRTFPGFALAIADQWGGIDERQEAA